MGVWEGKEGILEEDSPKFVEELPYSLDASCLHEALNMVDFFYGRIPYLDGWLAAEA